MAALLMWFGPAAASAADREVRIGVLAHRGAEKAVAAWSPTADYLTQTIPGTHFSIVPLTLQGTADAVSADELDFVLTNPAAYVRLEVDHGITRMVTLRNMRPGGDFTQFGAVILTRADRTDITSLQDLKGKSFGAVSEKAFGGWLMARRRLEEEGIKPEDLGSIEYMGFPQDDIVLAVERGEIDAGTVRTDVLERMVQKGVTKTESFRVLGARKDEGFPFAHSTRLYPEWAFASTRVTDSDLAQQVAVALLSLPSDHPAAKAAKSAGWTVPLDYQPVHDLLKELHVAPYDVTAEITLADIVERYWHIVAGTLLVLVAMTMTTAYVLRLNKSLEASKLAIQHEMQERRQAQEKMWASEKLASLGRVAAGVAHEINSPLGYLSSNHQVLVKYMNDLFGLVETYRAATADLPQEKKDALAKAEDAAGFSFLKEDIPTLMGENAEGMSRVQQIIQDMRTATHARNKRETIDLGALLSSTANLVRAQAKSSAGLDVKIEDDLPEITVVPSQIGRVVMNLLVNAHDAVGENGQVSLNVSLDHGKNEIVIVVSDNGEGIPEENLKKIFDPFFTTKDVGKGTGLGLSLSHDVVKRHGGTFNVESEVGVGSTFTVTLPVEYNESAIAAETRLEATA